MESLYLLIPFSVALVFVIALIFWWSVKNGQYDDLEGPGFRVLMDDDKVVLPNEKLPTSDNKSDTNANGG